MLIYLRARARLTLTALAEWMGSFRLKARLRLVDFLPRM
jgi:hypothetical protein